MRKDLLLAVLCAGSFAASAQAKPCPPAWRYDFVNRMCLPGPDVGLRVHTADADWWTTELMTQGFLLADYGVTRHYIDTQGGHEVNPILGQNPVRQIVIMEVTYLGVSYLSYHWKREDDARKAFGAKPHIVKWWWPLAVEDLVHATGVGLSIARH